MPKLGLGLDLTLLKPVAVGLTPRITLYSDELTLGGNFSNRQWFSSGANSGSSNSITYGAGEVRLITGTSGRHCLCHFDCMKDQYPTYSSSTTYNVGDIVYGGFAGHALYRKTAALAGGPVFTHATNAQDICGWTRYRPAAREIAPDKTLSISFKLKLDRTGYTITSQNAIRIGLFKSVGSYINYDSHGVSNAVFNGYSGYMFGYGPAHSFLLKRTNTADLALISTTSGVYSTGAGTAVSGFGFQDEYDVSIKLKRIGSSLELTSLMYNMYGSGYSSVFTHTDATAPVTSFDTLVFYTVSNNVASLALAKPVATYDGETQAIPTGIGSDDPANAAEPDATAHVLMEGPFYNTPGNPASNFVGGQSWRNLQPGASMNGRPSYFYGGESVRWSGSQWQYLGASGVISSSSSDVAYPWLATAWTLSYSATKITPTYAKPSNYPTVP